MLTWRAGEGGASYSLRSPIGPTLPSPPRHPGTARCAAVSGDRKAQVSAARLHRFVCGLFGCFPACPRIPVQAHRDQTGRVKPFRQSLLAGGRTAHPCSGAERGNVSPNQQRRQRRPRRNIQHANSCDQPETEPPVRMAAGHFAFAFQGQRATHTLGAPTMTTVTVTISSVAAA